MDKERETGQIIVFVLVGSIEWTCPPKDPLEMKAEARPASNAKAKLLSL